jgi:hypothetical protein
MSDSSRFPTLARVAVKLGLDAAGRRALLTAAAADVDNPRPQGQAQGADADDDDLHTDPRIQNSWAKALGTPA